jgi:hypothetical protein
MINVCSAVMNRPVRTGMPWWCGEGRLDAGPYPIGRRSFNSQANYPNEENQRSTVARNDRSFGQNWAPARRHAFPNPISSLPGYSANMASSSWRNLNFLSRDSVLKYSPAPTSTSLNINPKSWWKRLANKPSSSRVVTMTNRDFNCQWQIATPNVPHERTEPGARSAAGDGPPRCGG